MHIAASNNHWEVIEYLVKKHGAKYDAKDKVRLMYLIKTLSVFT